MIVDYIDPRDLPNIIVWMDWQLYAYGLNYLFGLGLCIFVYYYLGWYKKNGHSIGRLILIFTAFFFIECYVRNGGAVG